MQSYQQLIDLTAVLHSPESARLRGNKALFCSKSSLSFSGYKWPHFKRFAEWLNVKVLWGQRVAGFCSYVAPRLQWADSETKHEAAEANLITLSLSCRLGDLVKWNIICMNMKHGEKWKYQVFLNVFGLFCFLAATLRPDQQVDVCSLNRCELIKCEVKESVKKKLF